MGYYTRYDISNNSEDVREALVIQSGYGCLESDSIKWYDWANDIKAVSLRYPGTEVHVSGEGEESGDIWKAFAKDGLVYRAEVVLEYGPYKPLE